MSFATEERKRVPPNGEPPLHPALEASALSYFEDKKIAWWGGAGPTQSPISSQVACVNHLEPARVDQDVALALAKSVAADATAVRPVDGGWLAYEWIGEKSYLNEPGKRTRGANVTSLDAIMVIDDAPGSRRLVAVEWKYTETYRVGKSLAVSDRGTSRIEIYRPLLEHPDCPIRVDDLSTLFFEPFYQLMRQTLLAWQMTEHGEHGVNDWLHVLVIPEGNTTLRSEVTSPGLKGETMVDAWRQVLKEPTRYRVVTPTALLASVGQSERWSDWRIWLRHRYGT